MLNIFNASVTAGLILWLYVACFIVLYIKLQSVFRTDRSNSYLTNKQLNSAKQSRSSESDSCYFNIININLYKYLIATRCVQL